MKYDLHKTFGEIFDDDIAALRQQLLEIPAYHADRKALERWVQQLRFLDISNVPNLQLERQKQQPDWSTPYFRSNPIEGAKRTCIIPITRRQDDDGKIVYIAVSLKWPTRHRATSLDTAMRLMFNYMIQRPDANAHRSDFPDDYFERVIMFAQEKEITKLWIDKECIYQRKGDEQQHPKDHDLGMQIMDVVYGDSTSSVGLLCTPLVSQDKVETLSKLLKRNVFVDPENTDAPKLRSSVNIREVQWVILRILSDTRWSRGWM